MPHVQNTQVTKPPRKFWSDEDTDPPIASATTLSAFEARHRDLLQLHAGVWLPHWRLASCMPQPASWLPAPSPLALFSVCRSGDLDHSPGGAEQALPYATVLLNTLCDETSLHKWEDDGLKQNSLSTRDSVELLFQEILVLRSSNTGGLVDSRIFPLSHSTGQLTLMQGVGLYVAAVLGTGVITLPALAARIAGPASLLAWLGLILLSLPLALTFASLGTRFPDAGGVSTYVRYAFGSKPAAAIGWCFYFAVPVGGPAAGLLGGSYVAAVTGGGHRTSIITACALVGAVTVANAFGLTATGRLQLMVSGILIVLLLTSVITSVSHAHMGNLHPFAPHGWLSIGTAASLLVWSFAGWEAITHVVGEFRRPLRDVPKATVIAVTIVGALFLAVALDTILVLGPAAGTTVAPLSELLTTSMGDKARIIAATVAVFLTFGNMNAYYAAAAKLGAALSRDGALPSRLSSGSVVGEVPRRSLAVLAALSGLVLVTVTSTGVDSESLLLLAGASYIVVYILGVSAALRILPRGSRTYWYALISLATVAFLAVTTGWYIVCPLATIAAAFLYLQISGMQNRSKSRNSETEKGVEIPEAYRSRKAAS